MKLCLLSIALLSASFSQEFQIKKIGGFETKVFDSGAAEISAYDPGTKRLFFINAQANVIEALDIADPAKPKAVFRIFIPAIHGAGVNSIAIHNGIMAAAVEARPKTDAGSVVFYDMNGGLISAVKVGALPDMITFTPDGRKVMVANEGEPSDDYKTDPEGTVSIIDVSKGFIGLSQDAVKTADFKAFNGAKLDPSIRIYGPGATASQDIEPEYIAITPDSKTAYVTLQEANAIGIVDIETAKVTQLVGLGFKDHSKPGNGIDASDRDNKINIANWPVFGLYQPDGIATFQAKGKTWLITANEGDTRAYTAFNEEARVSSLRLDPRAFPNGDDLKKNENLGRLTVTNATGDIDGDGDFDALYLPGARSFTIWDAAAKQVFDSGDQMETINARLFPKYFNASSTNNTLDDRSDNKGPEPEGIAVAELNGKLYAFIGLERQGGVMVYDVTDPEKPVYMNSVNSRNFEGNPAAFTAGDLAPEGVLVIAGDKSPNGKPLLVTANETSGTVAIYELTPPAAAAAVTAKITAPGTDTFAREMTLDGSASTGDGLKYKWRTTGPSVSFFPASGDTPKITAQFVQGANAYTFELTVTDSNGNSSIATIKINYVGR